MKIKKNKMFKIIISCGIAAMILITSCIFQIVNLKKEQVRSDNLKAASVESKDNIDDFNKSVASDKYTNEISSGGFDKEDLKESKDLISELINELNQITMKRAKENLESYDEYVLLQNKIEENKAVYLLLKLKNNFGDFESILNEYLLSIQINIDLEKYLTNEDEYKKEKDESLKTVNTAQIITLSKIEEVYLEKTKETSNENNEDIVTSSEDTNSNNQYDTNLDKKNDINDQTLNKGESNINTNSIIHQKTEEILKEINSINDKSINAEGR